MNKFLVKHWLIIGVIGVVILGGIIAFLLFCSNDSKLQEQLDLGQKYMEDCDYEQAIVAFNKAIEIDDRSVEAYMGMTETYIRMSEFDNALEIARNGYEITGDERLAEYIDMIMSGNISRSDGLKMKWTQYNNNRVIMFSHEYTYDNENRQNLITHYDSNHNYVSSVELLYDNDGNPITSCAYLGESGELISYNLYYKNGLLIGQISNEDEPDWMQYEYDEKGNVIKRINGNGIEIGDMAKCEHVSIFQYNELNQCIREDRYDNKNQLDCSFTWEYDENGNRIRYSYYSAEGSLEWYELYEDDTTYMYDGEGNLLNYSIYE